MRVLSGDHTGALGAVPISDGSDAMRSTVSAGVCARDVVPPAVSAANAARAANCLPVHPLAMVCLPPTA
jgi:hypothetical protein